MECIGFDRLDFESIISDLTFFDRNFKSNKILKYGLGQ